MKINSYSRLNARLSTQPAAAHFLSLALVGLLFSGCGGAEEPREISPHVDGDKRKGASGLPRALGVPEELFDVGFAVSALSITPAHLHSKRKMNILLITARSTDLNYLAIRSFLQQVGIPHTVLNASTTELTADKLELNGVGNYQAVILATGQISAFSTTEWQTLWSYEADYGVRQMTFYTYPGSPDDMGLKPVRQVDTRGAPIAATFTTAGKQQFSYLNTSGTLKITGVYAYLATPRDSSVTPLLSYQGHALLSIKTFTDGRQNFTSTIGHDREAVHSLLLNYGMLNWLTKGMFLGERHMNLAAHVDDVFISDDLWNVSTNESGPQDGRMTGTDLRSTATWLQALSTAHPLGAALVFDMTFNGEGLIDYGPDDGLNGTAGSMQGSFRWLSHTYTHRNMSTASYTQAKSEIDLNNQRATAMGFANYFLDTIVTGGHTGLTSSATQQAAFDMGLRFMAADSSVSGYDNPTPNTGIPSSLQPSILFIPRIALNVDYDEYKPSQIVDQYNLYYHDYWGRNLTYNEILDSEADTALNELYKYNLDPQFFHQTNLMAYSEGGRTGRLLTDFMNVLLSKYEAAYALPLRSLSFHDIGVKMQQRRAFDLSGVVGTLDPGHGEIRLTVTKAGRIPVTGVHGATNESYGGQTISYFNLTPGTSVTIPLD